MTPLELHSFGDFDRSGKVRWTAAELGIPIEEVRVRFPEHRRSPYRAVNPLAQIPTAKWKGQTLIESTAICQTLVETIETPCLWIRPGDPQRTAYLQWMAMCGETLEGRIVDCAVSKVGLLGPDAFEFQSSMVKRKLAAVVAMLPAEGWILGSFTLVDIVAAYSFRLGLEIGLLDQEDLEPWLTAAMNRPAARASRFFESLI